MAERHDKEGYWKTDKDKERRGHEGAEKEGQGGPPPQAAEPTLLMVAPPDNVIDAVLTWMEAASYNFTGSIDASCCRKLIQLARAKGQGVVEEGRAIQSAREAQARQDAERSAQKGQARP